MPNALFRIFRGADGAGELKDYLADVTEGMVVLETAATQRPNTLAVASFRIITACDWRG